MIISKSALQVINIIKNDKVPVLNNVHIEQDGTVIGSNGKCILLVSPVTEVARKNLQNLIGDDPIDESGVTIAEEAAKDIMKNLPRDTQFKGLLEHCNISTDPEDRRAVEIKLTDGKRPKVIRGRRWDREYINYKSVLNRVDETKKSVRVVLNRRRLLSLLDTIDKACPDSTGNTAVYIEFSEENDIIVRAVNYSNGQRVLGIMQSYKDGEGEWLEKDEWEKRYWSRSSNKERKVCKIPKRIQ